MQMMLHSSAVAAPVSMVVGMRWLWFSVPSIRREMWGTVSPMNAIGPQNAVVTAVSRPVTRSRWLRVRVVLMPRLSAYHVPSSMALRGLMSSSDAMRP